jgi:hypothetical protein
MKSAGSGHQNQGKTCSKERVRVVAAAHIHAYSRCTCELAACPAWVSAAMKTDGIRTNITDIIFVFMFLSGFKFKYE